jgi:hypothetical protein
MDTAPAFWVRLSGSRIPVRTGSAFRLARTASQSIKIVLSASAYLNASPGALGDDSTILPIPSASSTPEIIVRASDIPTAGIHGDWIRSADATAAGGAALVNPDRGAPKITSPLSAPASYVDVVFQAQRGIRYHLWVRLRASGNAAGNDSVYVQFSGAVDGGGSPLYRIGTTNGAAVILQDFTGAPISGWGWNDNGWASFGADLYFASTGTQTLRLQPREDGVSVDQIVLSPVRYLTTSPGALINDTTVVVR